MKFFLFLLPYFVFTMTLEEKVGQLLMCHFNGEEVNEEARTLIQELHVGGIIYYSWANGLHSPEQIQKLSLGLQELTKGPPLLIAVDQEGGVISRLKEGFTEFPGNKALGMANDPQLTEECAFAIGRELLASGINMNLAPVVDVNVQPKNPVIGIRSFGEDPKTVSLFGKKALEGYRRAGVISCLKHYPGHGDVLVDSHVDLPVLKKTKEELEKVELVPFIDLAPFADCVMTAHIKVPSLDDKNCATLSRAILDILRQEIGFTSVVLTDSLMMEGLLKNDSIEEIAIKAFNAGADILLLGGKQLIGQNIGFELRVSDVKRIHKALVLAVEEGRISEERLNEAVGRILALKSRLGVKPQKFSIDEHRDLAKKAAKLAIRIVQNKEVPKLSHSKIALFAPKLLQDGVEASLLTLGKKTTPLFFSEEIPPEEKKRALLLVEEADLFIFCSYNAWKYESEASLLRSLLETKKPSILLVLRDPIDGDIFPIDFLVFTFSPATVSLEAAREALFKCLGKKLIVH